MAEVRVCEISPWPRLSSSEKGKSKKGSLQYHSIEPIIVPTLTRCDTCKLFGKYAVARGSNQILDADPFETNTFLLMRHRAHSCRKTQFVHSILENLFSPPLVHSPVCGSPTKMQIPQFPESWEIGLQSAAYLSALCLVAIVS